MKTPNHYIITIKDGYLPEHLEFEDIRLSLRTELEDIVLPLQGNSEGCLVYDLYLSNSIFTEEHYRRFINYLLETHSRSVYSILQLAYLIERTLLDKSDSEVWINISHTIYESQSNILRQIAKEITLENNLILAEYSLIKKLN